MSDTLPAALSAGAFAGLVAIAVTVAIERRGGRVGGLLGTLPTTIVPAAAGIAGSVSVGEFQSAMAVAPAGMLLNSLFLYLWRVVPPYLPRVSLHARLAFMTLLSLFVWLVGALLTVAAAGRLKSSGLGLLPVGWLLALALALIGWLACRGGYPAPAGQRSVGPITLLGRGILAAVAVGSSVWIAATGGAFAAGIVAVFPAIFVTTMLSLWLAQGEAVPSGAVGPMMLGLTSVAVYSLLAAQLLPALGPVVGSTLAWLAAALGVTLPAWLWLSRQVRKVALG